MKDIKNKNNKLNLKQSTQVNPYQNNGFGIFGKSLYRAVKYSTILITLLLIVIGGIVILGEYGFEFQSHKKVFELLQSDTKFNSTVQLIDNLFKQQNNQFISKKVVNFYPDQNSSFTDLRIIVEFLMNKRYEGENVVSLPINLSEDKISEIVPETHTHKLLQNIKQKFLKFMEKIKLLQNIEDSKDLTWNKAQKMLSNGKYIQLLQKLRQNIITSVYKWAKQEPSAYLLIISNTQLQKIQNKKAFNKWLRQHDNNADIIILSSSSLNEFYDQDNEDQIKSYEIKAELSEILSQQTLISHLSLNNAQVDILKQRIETISQLEEFLNHLQEQGLSFQQPYNGQELEETLEKVCSKSKIDYLFYEGQDIAYKVEIKPKKNKKASRVDRELQALSHKWSLIKDYLGLSKIVDVVNTYSSSNQDGLNLKELNKNGIVYDFSEHELHWRGDWDRLFYEIKSQKSCVNDQQSQVQQQEQQQKVTVTEEQEQLVEEEQQQEEVSNKQQEAQQSEEQYQEQEQQKVDQNPEQNEQINEQAQPQQQQTIQQVSDNENTDNEQINQNEEFQPSNPNEQEQNKVITDQKIDQPVEGDQKQQQVQTVNEQIVAVEQL